MPLEGFTSAQAVEILQRTGQVVQLKVLRHPQNEESSVEDEPRIPFDEPGSPLNLIDSSFYIKHRSHQAILMLL